jgi:DNA repair photolyase
LINVQANTTISAVVNFCTQRRTAMAASTLELPLRESPDVRLAGEGTLSPQRLPRVLQIERNGHGLHPSPFSDQPDVLSLNLTRGCVHRCPFCSIRAHSAYVGDDIIYLYSNSAEQLDRELSSRHRRPRAVFISPSTDPFPPIEEVQAETARVVEVLGKHEVEAWLMSRGLIRPSAMNMLAEQRNWVKVTIGLMTLDRELQRRLEPLCASPRLRLRGIAELRKRGIAVRTAIEPLIPGLTDTRECLEPVLAALAGVGVRHVRTSYLFLRSRIEDSLIQALEPIGWSQAVLDSFAGGPVLSAGTIAPARYLPKARRQRGYAALMAMAAAHGITVSICGATNPDFSSPCSPLRTGPGRASLFARLA